MMAKQAEDRYASYDDLIAALNAVPQAGGNGTPGVALLPLDDDVDVDWPRPGARREGTGRPVHRRGRT